MGLTNGRLPSRYSTGSRKSCCCAFSDGAYYPTISAYSAVDGVFDVLAVPVPQQAPYSLAGWGVVTPDPEHEVIPQTLAHLGVGGGEATRTKSADACTFNTALIEARHAYWDNANVESQSFRPWTASPTAT